MSESTWFGILNINKPGGLTSRDVVDQVQRLVRPGKVGHAGTLDPLATGVLVVCIGPATRLIEYVQHMPKRYRAEFLLGLTSSTEDVEGDVAELKDPPIPSRREIESAAAQMIGENMQRPPVFSAVKVDGRRAYKMARKGQVVELAPRPVQVHSIDIIEYAYPRLVLDIECGSGTYVRSLGRDLAESLGTGAVMSALERTAIGNFRVEDAIAVTALTHDKLNANLLPPVRAVEFLPRVNLNDDQQSLVARGQFIAGPANLLASAAEFAAFDNRGNLAAVLRRRSDGLLQPVRNFLAT